MTDFESAAGRENADRIVGGEVLVDVVEGALLDRYGPYHSSSRPNARYILNSLISEGWVVLPRDKAGDYEGA